MQKNVSFPNFNFKVDGFALWEALEKYIEAVVKDLYDSDLDVEDDPSIQGDSVVSQPTFLPETPYPRH